VALVHALDDLLEDVTVDLKPLQQQAAQLEEFLQKLKQQAAPAVPAKEPTPPTDMYR
jgi:predicted ATP-grasp superfamily ATP-dependent carboligase